MSKGVSHRDNGKELLSKEGSYHSKTNRSEIFELDFQVIM